VGSAKGKNAGRQSVAAARKSSGDRTQLIILSAAVVIIAIIVAVGVVLYKKSTAVQGSGYGVSTSSTAAVDDNGIITASNGSPTLVLDIYEDALCPICGEFEHQYGQQIAQAVDGGKLTVRYHMVNFLDKSSASGDYSTRAYGAMISLAKGAGTVPGLFMQFHSALFDSANQPKEGGSTDMTNAQLASLAGKLGTSATVQGQISSGADVSAAQTHAATNLTALSNLWGGTAQTPTVVHDGKIVSTNSVDWLTTLLPAGSASSGASGSASGTVSSSVSSGSGSGSGVSPTSGPPTSSGG
jgi:protein-disulfide isomerase